MPLVADPVKTLPTLFSTHKEQAVDFIKSFGGEKYLTQLQNVANRNSKVVQLFVDDLRQFDEDRTAVLGEKYSLAEHLLGNVRSYEELFYEAMDAVMPAPNDQFNSNDPLTSEEELRRHRERDSRVVAADPNSSIPKVLSRGYELQIVPSETSPLLPLRAVNAAHLGKYVKLRAVVSRTQPVRPAARCLVYECKTCLAKNYQEVEGDSYNPDLTCKSQACRKNKTANHVTANLKESKLVRVQEIKLQECADQVPVGCVPRTLNALVRGENTRKLIPGDSVIIGGFFAPIAPEPGSFAARSLWSVADTRLEVHHIIREKRQALEASQFTPEDFKKALSEDSGFFHNIARSIAPEIFEMDDVKKALLLLLVGGVPAEHPDGMRIRGDLHMLLMGDPGVAKSQLLKQVSALASRSVYSTGRGSSGAGLTAAVLRNKQTGEVSLEGGALVLADRGVCCIDEFDKMEEGDRTAIHQVMEQQVVSISKAGITTTLNARASVLAAANPAFGRYDVSKSAVVNMNLPASLLSRFDLQFLLLDDPNKEKDLRLAKHVVNIHRQGAFEASSEEGLLNIDGTLRRNYATPFLRNYVSYAKRCFPQVPRDLIEVLASAYVDLRKQERDTREADRRGYTTPRALLGILRLAQAHARIHLRSLVTLEDIKEAQRLTDESKLSVTRRSAASTSRADPIGDIWRMIKELHAMERRKFDRNQAELLQANPNLPMRSFNNKISKDRVVQMAQVQGLSQAQVDRCVREYAGLNAIEFHADSNQIEVIQVSSD